MNLTVFQLTFFGFETNHFYQIDLKSVQFHKIFVHSTKNLKNNLAERIILVINSELS